VDGSSEESRLNGRRVECDEGVLLSLKPSPLDVRKASAATGSVADSSQMMINVCNSGQKSKRFPGRFSLPERRHMRVKKRRIIRYAA